MRRPQSCLSRSLLPSVLLPAALLLAVVPSRAGEPADERERLPEGARVESLEVFPKAVELDRQFAYRQLLVTGRLETGERVDLTRMAELEVSAPGVVDVTPWGFAEAKANGTCELRIGFGEHSAAVPVRVSGQDEKFVADYVQDVQPVLSRVGCNSGTCHGSKDGKNGFKLSLRGNDYAFDHRALVDDLGGRRFNRADPDQSLFLLKVSGRVPHEGGTLTRPGEPYYEILRSWVAGGVELDLESPRVESIEVLPRDPVLPLPGMRQQMAVIATYTDGSVRDVTREAFIETSSTEVTEIDRRGVVTGIRRGECAVLARYEGRYDATPLIVMGDRSGWEWTDPPQYNWIDELVYEKLRAVKSLPSEVCTDAEFLRRVTIDLTGAPPTARETRTFLLDRRDSRIKRKELVERLIGSARFVEYWTNKWSDLLQVNPKWLGEEGARRLRDWIQGSVASNMPYDEFVRKVVLGSGSTYENPPAAYYKVLREPENVMENTTQLFLGIRFSCNKCHDHPFERWTQENYWELAAFFARVGRKDAPGSRKMPRRAATQEEIPAFEEVIFDKDEGEVSFPTGLQAEPSFPYPLASAEARRSIEDEAERRRQKLAAWLTSRENPYFARSFVNRVWSYFLGRGLIDPVDDIRAGNPPTNPPLLDRLEREFVESGFDVRHIMRLICTSRTYQHSVKTNEWNEDDEVNYSHASARRLPAEVLFDAIHRVTGSRPDLPGMRAGSHAIEADPQVKLADGFLDLFGRPARESACECERSSGMSLGQALNLVNGPTLAEAIRDPENDIAELARVEREPRRIVEELFLSILNRRPTEAERRELVKTFDARVPQNADALPPDERKALEERFTAWEEKQSVAAWQPLEVRFARSEGGAELVPQDDGSVLATGDSPAKDVYTLIAATDLEEVTGLRVEVLPHNELPAKGPGRAENGNFVLSELRVAAASLRDPSEARRVALQSPSGDYAQKGFGLGFTLDGKTDDEKGWAISDRFGQPHQAVYETKEDVGFEGGTLLTFTLEQRFGQQHTIGRLRLYAATSRRPVRHTELPEDVVAALVTPRDERSPEQRAAIWRLYIRGDDGARAGIRLGAAQDLAWALMNSPAFLFNH